MRVPRGLPNDVTHLEAIDICLIDRGGLTCRYLGRLRCLKHTVRAGVIDDRVKTGWPPATIAKGRNRDQ